VPWSAPWQATNASLLSPKDVLPMTIRAAGPLPRRRDCKRHRIALQCTTGLFGLWKGLERATIVQFSEGPF